MPTESVASSSSSRPEHHHHQPTRPVEDRIVRAIRHRLRLLHRSESDFFVLGATGNVYTVTLSSTPTCTCPDRTIPCKHILFILIRVLGVPLEDACLRRRTLRPCELSRLLTTPTSPEYLAGASVREKFHQLFLEAAGRRRQQQASSSPAAEEGATCPVCLDELGGAGENKVVVACGTCRNPIHEECLMTWKRIRRRRSTTCVICRARWRNNGGADDQEYLNLSAFVSEEDDDDDDDNNNMAEGSSGLSCID